MKTARFISVIFVLTIAIVASAQVVDQDEIIKRHTVEKVAMLYDYISCMANKNKSEELRMHWKTKALNMFIGNGYGYEENGVNKEGALIHIKTISGKIRSIPVRNYFQSLISGLRSYSNIKIETIEKHVVEEDTEDGKEYTILLGDVYAIENR